MEQMEQRATCPHDGWSVIRSGYIPDYHETYPLFGGDPYHDESVYGKNLKKLFGSR
eukprot:CAMPEP_0168729666 /NCGR_PEP_ID=MMETSP0724-20121128/6329_1 /TAXON_ID=265536 /ORGANISM="Amphiprora sp., Strain CCMP467" /LENGTH=55 /DNA_ID=CAMNT_0008776573 /DNA_START=115 /DNA_END=278 /DNA_ORIENTATION=-